MLRPIGVKVAAVIEEVLEAWLYEEAKMRCEVVLQADADSRRPLDRCAKRRLALESTDAAGDVVDVGDAPYRQLQHSSRRGIETEVSTVVPLPTETKRDAEIIKPLSFLDKGQTTACIGGGGKSRITEARLYGEVWAQLTT